MSLKTESFDLDTLHIGVGAFEAEAFTGLYILPAIIDNYNAISSIPLYGDTKITFDGLPVDRRGLVESVATAKRIAVEIVRDPMLYNKVVSASFTTWS